MNFSKIIKDAYQITIKNKFLWLLGLLAGGAGMGSNFYNYSGNSDDINKFKDMLNLPAGNQSALKLFTGIAHAASTNSNNIFNTSELIILGIVSIIIFLLLIYLSITSRGAIVFAVADLAKGRSSSLKSSWGMGHRFFWRRFSFGLLIFFIVIISLLILAIPAIAFGIAQLTIPAVIFGILAFIIFIIGVIYLSLITPIAERELFLNSSRPVQSLKDGTKIFNSSWGNFVVLYLIIFGFGLLFSLAVLLAFVVPGLVIFLISYLVYLLSHIGAYVVGGILILLVIVALIIFNGAFQSFTSSMITLGFLEKRQIS